MQAVLHLMNEILLSCCPRWTEATQEDWAIVVVWIVHKKVAAVTFSKDQEREKHWSTINKIFYYCLNSKTMLDISTRRYKITYCPNSNAYLIEMWEITDLVSLKKEVTNIYSIFFLLILLWNLLSPIYLVHNSQIEIIQYVN